MSAGDLVLTGAVAAVLLLLALFFVRFWFRTHDTFFIYFSAAFFLEGLDRVAIGLLVLSSEDEPIVYGVRFVAYSLILVAIWKKNRPRTDRTRAPAEK